MNPVICGIATTLAAAFLLTFLVRWFGPSLQGLSQARMTALAATIWIAAIGAGIWVAYCRWRKP